jgi:hypothetical protein
MSSSPQVDGGGIDHPVDRIIALDPASLFA